VIVASPGRACRLHRAVEGSDIGPDAALAVKIGLSLAFFDNHKI
jgi:hypothetical protein